VVNWLDARRGVFPPHQKPKRLPEGTLNSHRKFVRGSVICAISFFWAICARSIFAQTSVPVRGTNEIRIVELQGAVEISPAGAKTWVLTRTNQVLYPFDRLRTGPDSRVALRWSDESVVPFGASTELEILPPHEAGAQAGLHLVRGVISFFHRDKPGRIRVITRGAVAGIEGTEFVLAVNDQDRTTLSVIDGKVRFGNEQATLVLTNGEQATADVGQAPARTAGFVANNVLQWSFYYPAVLDPADLSLASDQEQALADSLTAYRAGDLLAALAKYPAERQPGSDDERIYHAALLLSVGEVDKAESDLASLSVTDPATHTQHLAAALRQLIAAVKHNSVSATAPQLTTEFMADSYYEQSRGDRKTSLAQALHSARQAAAKSPQFGFAWERVAELEFSFGHSGAAEEALKKAWRWPRAMPRRSRLKVSYSQRKGRPATHWFRSTTLWRWTPRWAMPGWGAGCAGFGSETIRAAGRICWLLPPWSRSAPSCGVIWAKPMRTWVISRTPPRNFASRRSSTPRIPPRCFIPLC